MIHPDELKAEIAIRATKFLNELHKEFCNDGLLSIGFCWTQERNKNGIPIIERTELNMEGNSHGSK